MLTKWLGSGASTSNAVHAVMFLTTERNDGFCTSALPPVHKQIVDRVEGIRWYYDLLAKQLGNLQGKEAGLLLVLWALR